MTSRTYVLVPICGYACSNLNEGTYAGFFLAEKRFVDNNLFYFNEVCRKSLKFTPDENAYLRI